jgi:hypothetical protein
MIPKSGNRFSEKIMLHQSGDAPPRLRQELPAASSIDFNESRTVIGGRWLPASSSS